MSLGGKFFNQLLKLTPESNGTFIGNRVWKPNRNTIFGGELVSQALVAAYAEAPKDRVIHNIQSRFIKSSDNNLPMKYEVKNLTSGDTFHLAEIRAIQNGSLCFLMNASFKRPEVDSLAFRRCLPEVHGGPIPHPDKLLPLEELLSAVNPNDANFSKSNLALAMLFYKFCQEIPCEARIDNTSVDEHKVISQGWLRIIDSSNSSTNTNNNNNNNDNLSNLNLNKPYFGPATISYLSDLGIQCPLFMKNYTFNIGLISSLNHCIWFHDAIQHEINPLQWFFFRFQCFHAGNGLSSNIGQTFSENGDHLATMVQEIFFRPTAEHKLHIIDNINT